MDKTEKKKKNKKKTTIITLSVIFAVFAVMWIIFGGFVGAYKSPAKDVDSLVGGGTKYIAHRGLSSEFYQNSAAAFIGAGQNDFFYGIETDIWRTSDGKYMCCHDETPFEDASVKITEIDYAIALTLPLAKSKAGEYVTVDEDVFICDFATYLSICAQYGKMPQIEIKYEASEAQLKEIIAAVKEIMPVEKVQFISFHIDVIKTILKIDSSITAQWIMTDPFSAFFGSASSYNIDVYDVIITKTLIDMQHRKNKILNAWTINDKKRAEKLESYGIDFITTDYDFSK